MVIGVCDDMDVWRKEEIRCLDQMKNELEEELKYVEFSSGREVIEYTGNIDILLLDIEMPEMNGIETMRILEDNDNVRVILFVTGYDSYVFDAFSSKTRGFIKKPVNYDELAKEIKIIIHQWKRKQRKLELKTVDGMCSIYLDDILYVYGEKNYVKLFAKNNEYMMYGNIKCWEDILEQYDIVRIHKSYLVNLQNVSSIQLDVKLKNIVKMLPLGRKYRDISRKLYDEYRIRRMREELGM